MYSGYGTGFDRRSSFSFLGGEFGQNVLIFLIFVDYDDTNVDCIKDIHKYLMKNNNIV